MAGFAEYLVTSAAGAVRLPESLTWADGALVEPLASSLHGVELAGIQPGSRVLSMSSSAVERTIASYAKRRFGVSPRAISARFGLCSGGSADATDCIPSAEGSTVGLLLAKVSVSRDAQMMSSYRERM
jgi:hypothetical protein